ncbi:Right handed beta helix region [Granulicella rosea]|uniref:Right handed beta helix region n=1 Tax=Granulicella rosea TaxID=474952 RepID=A0A239K557_9BACT|nr:glycoside hydrolase family 28 protein [Granulicella rosea]SNT12918.1 Right handed beta helix region [Granulicella rosea]
MLRRDLMKFAPMALATGVGYTSIASAGENPIAANPSATFNVRDFGATGDGKTVDTPAINRAIEAVAGAGGGTLIFPAGSYMCFTIRLLSHVDLYLSRGCIIVAADSPKKGEATGYRGGTYDRAERESPWIPYQDYGHNHWRNSLFYAEGQHDFGVFGPGLIFGKGLSNGSHGGRGGFDGFIAEQAGVGNKTFGLKNCHRVLLRDFVILKGGHFALLATGVDSLTIENLLVDTDRDGLDIDCCRNVRVSNCTINSPWDDAICPKSSYALGYQRPTENVTIANNYVTAGFEIGSVANGTWKRFPDDTDVIREGRIKCGTESNGGFRNITITGNVIEACKGIALESSDGALIEDIAITGNTMRDIIDAPLFLCLNRRERNPNETARAGSLRRILISNLVCHNADASTSSMITGIPTNCIEDIKIANCYLGHKGLPKVMRVGFGQKIAPMPDWRTIQTPEREDGYPEPLQYGPTPVHGFLIRHLRNLEMSHVEIAPANADPRPAFRLEDVHRADFFAITAPPQENFSLHNVTDFRLAWSRAAKDTAIAHAEHQTL